MLDLQRTTRSRLGDGASEEGMMLGQGLLTRFGGAKAVPKLSELDPKNSTNRDPLGAYALI